MTTSRILLLSLALAFSAMPALTQDVDISIQNVDFDTRTFEVQFDSSADVAGFQFDVSGTTITNVTGGLAESASFDVSFNPANGRVLGFGFGTMIPSGSSGALTVIHFDCSAGACWPDTPVCLSGVVFADPAAMSLTFSVGPCFDMSIGSGYCSANPNSTGSVATISALGSESVATNVLQLSAGPVPNQPGLFFFGQMQVQLPFGNGFRCAGGSLVRLPVVVAQDGILAYSVDNSIPPASSWITAGATLQFQAWYRDPLGGGSSFNLSNGLELSFVP